MFRKIRTWKRRVSLRFGAGRVLAVAIFIEMDLGAVSSERLKNAQIENLPAVEVISRYNTADVFMYVDPPYLHGTRKNYLYRCEMNDTEHVELLEVLRKHPGKILLSGYENDLYNEMLPGWKKVSKNTQAEAGIPRTETLWMNYEVGQVELPLGL